MAESEGATKESFEQAKFDRVHKQIEITRYSLWAKWLFAPYYLLWIFWCFLWGAELQIQFNTDGKTWRLV